MVDKHLVEVMVIVKPQEEVSVLSEEVEAVLMEEVNGMLINRNANSVASLAISFYSAITDLIRPFKVQEVTMEDIIKALVVTVKAVEEALAEDKLECKCLH